MRVLLLSTILLSHCLLISQSDQKEKPIGIKEYRHFVVADSSLLDSLKQLAYDYDQDSLYVLSSQAFYEIGHISRRILPDFERSFESYALAYNRFLSMESPDSASASQSAYWGANVARQANMPDSAYRYFQHVVQLGAPNKYLPRSYYQLAMMNARIGDYVLAKTCLDQLFATSHLFVDDVDVLDMYIGQMLIALNEDNELFMNRILSNERSTNMVIDSLLQHGDYIIPSDLGPYYQNMAACYHRTGNLKLAIEYAKLGLAHTSASSYNTIADLSMNLGIYYRKQDLLDSAIAYSKKALDIIKSEGNQITLRKAMAFDNYAEIKLAQYQIDSAIFFIDSAIHIACYPVSLNNLLLLNNEEIQNLTFDQLNDFLTYLADKVRALKLIAKDSVNAIERTDYIIQHYEMADQVIDHIQTSYGHERTKFLWRDRARNIYDLAVVESFGKGLIDQGIGYFDKAKGLILMEAMRKTQASNVSSLHLLNRYEELNDSIGSIVLRLYKDRFLQRDSLSTLRKKLILLRQNLNNLNAQMCAAEGTYCSIAYSDFANLTRYSQAQFDSGQSLLSYFLTPDTIIGLRIDHTGDPTVKFLGSRHKLDSLMARYKAIWKQDPTELGSADRFSQHMEATTRVGHALYQLLLAPLGELPERLVIIPDEALLELNFDMLLKSIPEEGVSYSKYHYMIRDHAITYGHSIATWLQMSDKRVKDPVVAGFVPRFAETPYQDLQRSREILPEINESYRFRPYFDNEATRENLREFEGANMIHFETHAVLNDSLSNFSYLLMSKDDGQLDSFFLQDVYHLDIPGSFVAIPNCETHRGNVARGEGVISLARAFTYAGASSIITSLWVVKETPSAKIMQSFYRNMAGGMTKDKALQQAKLEFIDNSRRGEEAHPYVWASLIHIGNNEPIRGKSGWWYYALGLIVIAAGIVAWRRRNSIKREHSQRAA